MRVAPARDACPTARTRLAGDPTSARLARRFVGATLSGWGCDALCDTAVLLASEVVGNAIRHTTGEVEIFIRLGPQCLRLEVVDGSPAPPVVRQPVGVPAERGLGVVAGMAARWGWEPLIAGPGKRVWFELAR